MTETVDSLLDTAEAALRARGYHAVSFRELAEELGIRSASVHYHFRRKEDLVRAVIDRYSHRFFTRLEDSATAPLAAVASAYAELLVEDGRPCLCGVLAAEFGGLPEEVAEAVRGFFRANLDWLEDRLGDPDRAAYILAALQGGMVIAGAMEDNRFFGAALAGIRPD